MRDDFTAVKSVTIPTGQESVSFAVDTTDDNIVEKNDFIVYAIADVKQQGFEKLVANKKSIKTKIIDEKSPDVADPSTAFISLTADNSSLTEDMKSTTITATLSQKAEKDLKITLGYSGQATNGSDYSAKKALLIKKGTTASSVTLSPINDNVVEGDETIVIAIAEHGDAGLEDLRVKESVSVLLKDDKTSEAPSKLSAQVSLACPKTLAENNKAKLCQVTLSQNPLEDVVITLAYSGSAEYDVDYEAVKSVVIKKGTRSVDFKVSSLNDVLKEGSENIVIALAGVKQTLFEDIRLQEAAETIALNDEKRPEAIKLTLEGAKTVVEGQPNQYTLTLSQKAVKDVHVTLAYSKNSADFKGVDTVTIPAGQQSISFAVETIDDNVVENNDVMLYSIAKVKQQGFEKLAANKKSVKTKIVDEKVPANADDATAYITLYLDSDTVSEDVKRAKVTAKLSQKAQKDLSLTLAYSGQSKMGQDFKANDKITIKKGSTEGYTYLYPVNDNLLEGSESVLVDVIKHDNGGLEDVRVKETLTASIVDEKESKNSPKASVKLTGPSKVSEPDLSKPYMVKIDQKTNDDMVVSLTYSGSADSSDYNAVKSVTIPKGTDSVTFTVQTLDDNATEDLEEFTISIAKVEGGGLENVAVVPNVVRTALSDELDIAKEFERIVSDQVIEFDSGSREINEESKKPLNKIAALLKRYTKAKIVILGHTNSVGNPAYNKRLSQDRAVNIRIYLVSQGVSKRRIKAIGYGSTRPLLAEDHPEAMEVNRRVEFKVVY